MRFVNWLIDTIYDFFEYLIMLLVLAIAVVVILWRLDMMFNLNIPLVSRSGQVIESTIQTTKDSIKDILAGGSLEGETITVNIPEIKEVSVLSKILSEYELINDKEAFEKYINDNKLLPEIVPGKHQIKIGSSVEEIVNILRQKNE